MYRDKIIKISRSKYTEESVEIAILKLDQIFHYKGTYCMINYKDIYGNLDSVVALGIKDGIGRDCYKIVSLHKDNIVWDVKDSLPDVSNLTHNERYLYENENSKWFVVYGENSGSSVSRVIRPIEEFNYSWIKFINLADYTEWIYNPEDVKVRLLYDFYNQNEIDELIDKVRQEVRYVEFESLTPSQIETLRGPAGSVDNLVVLTEEEYQNLSYKDPNKFYFTYNDSQLFVHVDENTVLIIESHFRVDENTLEINYPKHTRYSSDNRLLWLSNDEIEDRGSVIFSRDSGTFSEDFYLTLSTNSNSIIYYYVKKLIEQLNTTGTKGDVVKSGEFDEPVSVKYSIYREPILINMSCSVTAFTTTSGENITKTYIKLGDKITVDENTNIIDDRSGVNFVDENNNWDIETPGEVDDNNILNL